MTASLTSSSPIPLSTAPTDAGTYTDLNGLAALKNAPTSPATIKAVSQQVEALFLQMMLKSMRDASDGEGGETTSNETGMYQDMFDKQVALTLSKRQDLGISRLFERQMGGNTAPDSAAVAGSAAPLRAGQPRVEADGHAAAAPSTAATDQQAAEFVQKVLPTIQRAAQALGVHPLGMLAQAALETGWGRRMPRTADGSPSLNLFGVKASDGWTGARAVADTVEISGGVATQRRTAFRAYGSIEDGVADFAKLLASSPRYRDAVAAGGSAQSYVASIARSGYATDPEYGNKLNQVLNGGTLRSALQARVAKL